MVSLPQQFVSSESFRHSFDRRPFLFQHALAQHDLFTFPALHRLARLAADLQGKPARKGLLQQPMTPGFLVVKDRGSLRWGSPEFYQTLDDTFEHFEQSNVRLKLTAIHRYEGYREVLEECTRSLSEVTGVDFARRYDPGIATLFIASPNETTPYHIDQEVNFLVQIHGRKQVCIFDGDDREIVSQKNLEEFWSGKIFIDQVAGSSPEIFEIEPGNGVFNPPFFPHLVTTGPQPCVSLSLGYARRCFPEAELHRMNAYMRKLGWTPQSPGKRPRVDQLKSMTVRHATALKRSVMGI